MQASPARSEVERVCHQLQQKALIPQIYQYYPRRSGRNISYILIFLALYLETCPCTAPQGTSWRLCILETFQVCSARQNYHIKRPQTADHLNSAGTIYRAV